MKQWYSLRLKCPECPNKSFVNVVGIPDGMVMLCSFCQGIIRVNKKSIDSVVLVRQDEESIKVEQIKNLE